MTLFKGWKSESTKLSSTGSFRCVCVKMIDFLVGSSAFWLQNLTRKDFLFIFTKTAFCSGHGGHHDSSEAVHRCSAGSGGRCQEEGDGNNPIINQRTMMRLQRSLWSLDDYYKWSRGARRSNNSPRDFQGRQTLSQGWNIFI